MDNQLINCACKKCGATTQPGIVIMNINGMWLCGNCFMIVNERNKKRMLELWE